MSVNFGIKCIKLRVQIHISCITGGSKQKSKSVVSYVHFCKICPMFLLKIPSFSITHEIFSGHIHFILWEGTLFLLP